MPRCSCAGNSCSCAIQSGTGITVTGTGSATSPFVVSVAATTNETLSSVDGVLDLSDIDVDSLFEVVLHEDVTSVILPRETPARVSLALRQGATAYTVAWPSAVKWAGGTAPVVSTGPGHVDWVALRQLGDVWLGVVEGVAIH